MKSTQLIKDARKRLRKGQKRFDAEYVEQLVRYLELYRDVNTEVVQRVHRHHRRVRKMKRRFIEVCKQEVARARLSGHKVKDPVMQYWIEMLREVKSWR